MQTAAVNSGSTEGVLLVTHSTTPYGENNEAGQLIRTGHEFQYQRHMHLLDYDDRKPPIALKKLKKLRGTILDISTASRVG
jgi:hypothetical protein